MDILLIVIIVILIGILAFFLVGYGIIWTEMGFSKTLSFKTRFKQDGHWDDHQKIWLFGAFVKTEFGLKKHGLWISCHDNGDSEYINYKRGIISGIYKKLNANKEIIEEGTYEGSMNIDSPPSTLKIGEWKTYHLNGSLKSKGNYKSGKKDGDWFYYFENGKIESNGKYLSTNFYKGRKHGEWRFYEENGFLLKKILFEEGKEII